MLFRHSLSRRDAFLLLLGASSMHIWSLLFNQVVSDESVVVEHFDKSFDHLKVDSPFVTEYITKTKLRQTTLTTTAVVTETVAQLIETTREKDDPQPAIHTAIPSTDVSRELPHTSIVSNAPGWTVFRDLYMSNGTLYIVSPHRDFPKIRDMISVSIYANNDPDNIAAREPTPDVMDIITPEEAQQRWGAEVGEKNRVWSIEGNTFLFNDPNQFFPHYYHFVAELFFGVWAFWHGTWSTPTSPSAMYSFSHPAPPPVDRAIFAHSDAQGWRDHPGFNAYFLRAAFPSLTIEVEDDWLDRIAATRPDGSKNSQRAWHFPVVLLADRSAAHRGGVCGSQTQRTASEAWEHMRLKQKLMGMHVGGWWEPIRAAVWRFAGVRPPLKLYAVNAPPSESIGTEIGVEAQNALAMPEKIVVTYISRQGGNRRKLVDEDHLGLLIALKELVDEMGDSWELKVLEAENLTKDEQIKAASETTFMVGVHGNGLTHLVFMQPTRISTVIEIFYPEGFAHDYQWTTRALGMTHFAIWNDTHHSHPNKPPVNYPEPGFQGNEIPVHGPAVAQLIKDRFTGKL